MPKLPAVPPTASRTAEHTHSWRTVPGSSDLRKAQRCGERRKLWYTGGGFATTQPSRARQPEH